MRQIKIETSYIVSGGIDSHKHAEESISMITVTITGLSVQLDLDVEEGDEQKAKDVAMKRIAEINDLLRNAGDDAQIFGGNDITRSQIVMGDGDLL